MLLQHLPTFAINSWLTMTFNIVLVLVFTADLTWMYTVVAEVAHDDTPTTGKFQSISLSPPLSLSIYRSVRHYRQ